MEHKLELAKMRNKYSIQKLNHLCLPEKYDIETWNDIIKSGVTVVVKDKQETIIGYCAVTDIFTKRPCIVSIAVHPEYRGKGLGGELLDGAIDYSKKKWKDTQMVLHVRPSNTVAKHLYETKGFKIKKVIKDYYVYDTGNEDGIEMVFDI